MQCKELEAVLESEGLSPLPPEAREHLAGCSNCQDLLADLSAIVVAAKRVPAEVTPPDRIWISVRAQLEAEGIIRDAEPRVPPAPSPWWHGFAELFRPRVLAGVGAGLFLVVGSFYFVEHRGTTPIPHRSPRLSRSSQPNSKTGRACPRLKRILSLPAKNSPAPIAVGPADSAPAQPRPSSSHFCLRLRRMPISATVPPFLANRRCPAPPRPDQQRRRRRLAAPEPAHPQRIYCGM